MKCILLDFRSAKQPWFEAVQDLYLKKIGAFCEFEVTSLKTLKQGRDESAAKVKFEESELLKKIKAEDYVILFDEMGQDLTSIQFSQRLETAATSGKKRIVFIVGGAYGVSENIKLRAQLKICLSKMVLNHLVAETVVLEQIYRAMTIQNRIPYHNI
jgi:23S rRNA (pseudouridine1915-N3)-methyltransferase